MTYTAGNLIAATDLNTFVGVLNNLWGQGTGTRGYGQAGSDVSTVASGATISAADWTTLRTRLLAMVNYVGLDAASVPSAGVFDVSDVVQAHDSAYPSSGDSLNALMQLSPALNAVDTNRIYLGGSNKATQTLDTSVKSTSWVTGLDHIVQLDFVSEDEARYFFNSGSKIWLEASRSGGSAIPENTAFTDLFDDMGTIVFDYTETTNTGSSGTPLGIGYYGLTGIDQQIFSISSGGLYTGAQYRVLAKRANYVGTRGGNGSRITFTIQIDDTDSTPKDGTLTSTIGMYRANNYITAVAPTASLVSGL